MDATVGAMPRVWNFEQAKEALKDLEKLNQTKSNYVTLAVIGIFTSAIAVSASAPLVFTAIVLTGTILAIAASIWFCYKSQSIENTLHHEGLTPQKQLELGINEWVNRLNNADETTTFNDLLKGAWPVVTFYAIIDLYESIALNESSVSVPQTPPVLLRFQCSWEDIKEMNYSEMFSNLLLATCNKKILITPHPFEGRMVLGIFGINQNWLPNAAYKEKFRAVSLISAKFVDKWLKSEASKNASEADIEFINEQLRILSFRYQSDLGSQPANTHTHPPTCQISKGGSGVWEISVLQYLHGYTYENDIQLSETINKIHESPTRIVTISDAYEAIRMSKLS